jgi:Uri superfamily endonuclease
VGGVDFPSHKGTYILILHLSKSAKLTIGKLGVFDLPAGYYAYVGSAFGAGGLRGRLKHHLSPVRKPYWHIDYLRQSAIIHEVWYVFSATRYEHEWADALRLVPGAVVPVPRFGASDCRCMTHLIYFEDKPDFASFCDEVGFSDEIQLCIEKTDHSAHN